MTFLKELKLGLLKLPNNIIFAPLAEYTDYPFRRFIRQYHKGLIFCEMVKMEALVRDKCDKIVKYDDIMHPIGAQLCGSNPAIASDAAKKIEQMGFDVIDLNCGCPVYKIVKDGSGAAMLKNPNLIYKILCEIKKSVKIPVTIKTRIGWDENSICIDEIAKIASDSGCSAITIHGRTKKQLYSGVSDWQHIKRCKENNKNILIIANGDIYTPQDAKRAFAETGCDGIMIARGMLKNPNISSDISAVFSQDTVQVFDKKDALLKYIGYCRQEKGEEKTLYDIRKMCGWLLRGEENIKQLRISVNNASSTKDAESHIKNFAW